MRPGRAAIAASLAIAALLTGCSDDGLSRDDVRSDLVDGGVEPDIADCIVDELGAVLGTDDFSDFNDQMDEGDPDAQALLDRTVQSCTPG